MTLVPGSTNGYRDHLPTGAEWERGGHEVDIASFRAEAADLYVEAALEVLQALAS